MSELFERLQKALPGRYQLLDAVGRGAMALVYRARDTELGREVAVKVLRPDLAGTLAAERFLQEIEIASRLNHPNILPVHDAGQCNGFLYFVMPYVDGETLSERIERETQLSVKSTLRIAREVADALAYAHTNGVVHRDIKPSNILLSDGHAVVADFGVSRAVWVSATERLTEPDVAIGTPAYMSPEQAGGRTDVDGRSDVYSLGCVVYEMLVGEPPFGGPSAQAVLAKQLSAPAPSVRVVRPAVSPDIERMIEVSLEKVAADRFTTAGAFAAALEAFETGSTQVHLPRSPAQRRRIWTGVGLAVLSLVLWFGVLSSRRAVTDTRLPTDSLRVAVLYFEDRSGNDTLAHVADGLTEDLIDALGSVSSFTVITPRGVAPYRDRDLVLPLLAGELGVHNIVTGSVEPRGDSVVLTVRLADAFGAQINQGRVVEHQRNLVALRDSAVENVSSFLRQALGDHLLARDWRRGTSNPRALQAFYNGEQRRRIADDLSGRGQAAEAVRWRQVADSIFAVASSLDPTWIDPVLARGRIARALGAGARTEAFALAETALGIDDMDPRALELRGSLFFNRWLAEGRETDAERAVADLEAAVGRDESAAGAWYWLASARLFLGEIDPAATAARRALAEDAFLREGPTIVGLLFSAYLQQHDIGEAESWCRTWRRRYPDHLGAADCRMSLLGWTGLGAADVDRAWEEIARVETIDPIAHAGVKYVVHRLWVAAILARSGQVDSALSMVARLAGRVDPTTSPGVAVQAAWVRLLAGQEDAALTMLERVARAHPQMGPSLGANRWFGRLGDNPRFEKLIAASDR